MKRVLLIVLFLSLSGMTFGQWSQTSGPTGGQVNASGCNGSNVFAAMNGNGVFRSTDNGSHWTASGLSNSSITGFIFIGNYVIAVDGSGILWRSSNNGSSWINLNFPDFPTWYTVKGNYIFVDGYQGMFRSSDNGNNWVLMNNGITSSVYSMTSNSNYVFAGSYQMIFRSSDNGNNWVTYNLPSGVIAYSMITNGSVVLIGSNAGVYRSTDNGINWVKSGLDSLGISSFAKSGNSIFVNSSYNFVGEIIRTDNNGVSWKVVNSDIISTAISSIAANNQYVFAGFYLMGISRSSTKGNDWVVINNGLKSVDVNCIISMDNDLYAGNTGTGIYYSNNNGNSWTDYNIGLKDLNIYTFAVNKKTSTIYAGTDNGVLYTSPNTQKWTPLNNGFTDLGVTAIGINGKKMYANAGGKWLYVSTNGGTSWDTTGLKVSGFSNISKIAFGTNIIYTTLGWHHHSATSAWVNASTDEGATWNQIFPTDNMLISGITGIIAKGDDVFIGCTDVKAGTETGIFRSTNKGANWTKIVNGLSDLHITSLCYINNDIIAGTASGNIYKSLNKGDSWVSIASGLPVNKAVNCLTVNDYGIFSGIQFTSVWKYSYSNTSPLLSSINTKENVLKNELMQNNPNPFNPVTKIKYQISEPGNVSLKVYNITGKEVTTLVNAEHQPGNYEVLFDGTYISSGIYFYKLIVGSSVEVRKMLLIK